MEIGNWWLPITKWFFESFALWIFGLKVWNDHYASERNLVDDIDCTFQLNKEQKIFTNMYI